MEFELSGHKYVVTKLKAKQQFHIVRRLLPVMKSFAPLIERAAEQMRDLPQNTDRSKLNLNVDDSEAIAMLLDAIENLTDESSDFIIDMCLNAVQRVVHTPEGARLQPITVNGRLLFEELDDLAVQIRIVWEVLSNNLANFSFDQLPIFQNQEQILTNRVLNS
jgi:hypothetical protein